MPSTKNSSDDLNHSAIELALQRLSLPFSASEYHGSVCGRICANQPDSITLETEGEPAAGQEEMKEAWRNLESCWRITRSHLEAEDMQFESLMPQDEADLIVRVAELGAWCRGFLYGLASNSHLTEQQLGAEGQEILEDLAAVAQVGLGNEDGDVEEEALAEIVEYIRVTTQILYLEFRKPAQPPAANQNDAQTRH